MTTTYNVQIVAESGNAKTGPIPVTYRGMGTCPPSCPFLPTGEFGGCYGTGRIFSSAERYQRPMAESDMFTALGGARRAAKYLRDRVVGDLRAADGSVDYGYMRALTRAAVAQALRPFGYSHMWEEIDPTLVPEDYVLNASTEAPEDAERAVMLGFPVVITNDDIPEGTMIAGKRVITCPAIARDDVTCASCGLCAKPASRAYIVRFFTHGTAKRKARLAIAAMVALRGRRA